MRRAISTMLSFAVLATLAVPGGAGAESRCDADLVVFSRNSNNLIGSVNWNGVACIPGVFAPAAKAVADQAIDFRLINPNSDRIRAVYVADDVPRQPSVIRLRFDGLGMSNKRVFAARTDLDDTGAFPDYGYEGPELTIDPQAQGCLKVDAWYSVKRKVKRGGTTVTRWVKIWSDTTTYHTIDTVAC